LVAQRASIGGENAADVRNFIYRVQWMLTRF
jgi:hypothetical protein